MKSAYILSITLSLLAFVGFSYFTYTKYIESHPRKFGVTTDYNCYMFAIQWPLGVCAKDGSSCYRRMAMAPKLANTIHGLWPGYYGERPIPYCNDGIPVDVEDDGSALFIEMRKYWPSLKGPNENFWNHEFNKHGYCYTQKIGTEKYQSYFYKGLEVLKYNGYNNLVVNALGTHSGEYEMDFYSLKTALESYLGGSVFQFQCVRSGYSQYLSEIRIQLDLNFKPIETEFRSNCNTRNTVIIPYEELSQVKN